MLCEGFGYTVTQALWELTGIEWESAPAGLHWDILALRGYADARRQVDANRKDKNYKLDITPLVRVVWDTERAIAEEKRRQHDEQSQSGGGDLGG